MRADLKSAKREQQTGNMDLFGGMTTGNEFAARWIADQEAGATSSILATVPESPRSIAYGELWPIILAEHGVRKVRLGQIAAKLKAEGALKFSDWELRKRVPGDSYRVTR
jgi:hypothetical protein